MIELKTMVLVSLSVTFFGCDRLPQNDEIFQTWMIQSMHTVSSIYIPSEPEEPLYLSFAHDESYNLVLEVNRCKGSFNIGQNGEINLSLAACTEMCCDSEFSEHLVPLLSQVTRYNIEGTKLTLSSPDGFITATLNK